MLERLKSLFEKIRIYIFLWCGILPGLFIWYYYHEVIEFTIREGVGIVIATQMIWLILLLVVSEIIDLIFGD